MPEHDEFIGKLEAEAERLEEDCTYNNVGQFVSARRRQITQYWLDLPAVLLTAFSAVFAFTEHALLAGILSVVVLLLTTASLFLQPASRASRHKNAGEKYLALRTTVRLFREVDLKHLNRGRDRLNEQLLSFIERKTELNNDSPSIPDSAYKEAKSRILQGRATHDSDLKRLSSGNKTS